MAGDYYFSYYFSYYDTLSVIIFPIIFNYDRVSAPENGNVQTAILDPFTEEWLISVLDELEKIHAPKITNNTREENKALVENGVKNTHTALDAHRKIIAQESNKRQKIMAA